MLTEDTRMRRREADIRAAGPGAAKEKLQDVSRPQRPMCM